MKRWAMAAALAAGLGVVAAPAWAGGVVAFDRPEFQAPVTIQVTVNDVAPGGTIPVKFTGDGKNLAPATRWTPGPGGTKSYVLVVQDPDAPGSEPAVHWLVYDLPARFISVPGGMRNIAQPANPLGVSQGWNNHGSVGYSGPRPPVGDAPHHYHFQVFALDRPLHVHPAAQFVQVANAMKGHVIARGEVVATYAAPQPKEAKPGAASDGKSPGVQ